MDSQTSQPPLDEAAMIQAFKQRRRRQRYADLLSLIGYGVVFGLVWYGARRGVSVLDLLWLSTIIFFGTLIGAIVFTQWNWRCPACGSALASWKVRIDSWFSPEPLNCPYCKTKLL